MSDLTIIQVSKEELLQAIGEVVESSFRNTWPTVQDDTLLTVNDICALLSIKRSRFEFYKKELIAAGMFRLNDSERSSYRMMSCDFQKWLQLKKNNHD